MVIRILGSPEDMAYIQAKELCMSLGYIIDDGSYFVVDLAIAPLLTKRVSQSELEEPLRGTLIFHPSPLPYGRGASSIRWAYRRKEPITAATWFWANAGAIDSGDICEQEVIKIDYLVSPREYYTTHVVPAMLRTLERALISISSGVERRVPQNDIYASFDSRIT